jgi:hypothetical protein
MEDRMEREAVRKVGEDGRGKEQSRNTEEEIGESEFKNVKDRIAAFEDMVREGERSPEKKDREAHVRIDKLEKNIAKDKAERQEFEWNIEGEKGIQDAKDVEKDMAKKLEEAMEQVKVLNLDFGKECTDRRTLVKEAISRIKEKLTVNDKEEFDRIMKGARVDILGKNTSTKESGKGRIHTVLILIVRMQECEGKIGGDCKESRYGGNKPMAERMHGVC